jgi:hypothetical protein
MKFCLISLPILSLRVKKLQLGCAGASGVFCSAIHNSQVMETTNVLHYWRMDQENVVLVHNGILLSHEEDEILSFTGKWMELENIILSEVSQAQKTKNHMFSLICGL